MGWIKEQQRTSGDIFTEIITERPKWNGNIGDSSSPYEYWSGYLRDNYAITLQQCDEICSLLKAYYHITDFYHVRKPVQRKELTFLLR